MRRNSVRRGFTLLEILVVVAITGLLSSYLVMYNGTSREQVTLAIESAKLAQIVSRAKALTVSTYGASGTMCGYGIHVDYANRKYQLIAFNAPTCKTLAVLPTETVNATYELPPEVVFGTGNDALTDVYFLPPDPKTYLNIGGVLSATQNGSIYLEARGGSAKKTVKVSQGGQISF